MTWSAQPNSTAAGGEVTPLRLIVVDDHPLYRESIVQAVTEAGEVVVADGADGTAGLALIREHQPDVALVDVRLPGLDGIDVVAALARHGPAVPVVLLSAFGDAPLMRAGLQAGAAAYITKDADREVILRAVRAAATPARAPHVLAGSSDLLSTPRQTWIPRLTGKEYRLLTMAHDGVDKADMVRQMRLEEDHIHRLLASAIDKLGADTLPEALRVAVHAGILREHADVTGLRPRHLG
jgi:two-component system, NarL family, nitrate/nitrite response regulator NarL